MHKVRLCPKHMQSFKVNSQKGVAHPITQRPCKKTKLKTLNKWEKIQWKYKTKCTMVRLCPKQLQSSNQFVCYIYASCFKRDCALKKHPGTFKTAVCANIANEVKITKNLPTLKLVPVINQCDENPPSSSSEIMQTGNRLADADANTKVNPSPAESGYVLPLQTV